MTVYPFIEAEKVAERNVVRACELLEVSRSAYYAQRDTTPSCRELAEAELTAAIVRLHETSKGVYGAPKIHDDLKDSRSRRPALGRTDRVVLGQRPGRELVLSTQNRVHRPARLAHPHRRPHRGRRLHQLV